VGNITKDILITKQGKFFAFGGASYSGITASKLGYDSNILTRGNPVLENWIRFLKTNNINVIFHKGRKTTSFINCYTNNNRKQKLLEYTRKINFNISRNLDIIHLNPVYREIDVKIVKKARERCEILSLDVQGLVRDRKGNEIVNKFWNEREKYMRYIDFLKIGKYELRSVSKKNNFRDICEDLKSHGARIIGLTLGKKGSIIYDGDLYYVPAYKTRTVDETGAGDVYGASFVIKYFETKSIIDSALFASASASFVVEGFGVNKIAERNEVEKRYEFLKNKV
jgi:sugar/nucleoside kinase (ribokinase family)